MLRAHDGILTYNQSVTGLLLNKVNSRGAGGYRLNFSVTGEGSFSNVMLTGAASGGLNNPDPHAIVRGEGNAGLVMACAGRVADCSSAK